MGSFVKGLHKRWFALLAVCVFVEFISPGLSEAALAYVLCLWFYELFVSTGRTRLGDIDLETGFIADTWHRATVIVLLLIEVIVGTALVSTELSQASYDVYFIPQILNFVSLITIVLMIVSDALDPYHADVDESMKLIAELFKKKFRFYIFASVHFGLNEGGQQAADRLKVRLEEEDIGLLIIDTSQGVDVSPLVFDALELCDAFMVFGVSCAKIMQNSVTSCDRLRCCKSHICSLKLPEYFHHESSRLSATARTPAVLVIHTGSFSTFRSLKTRSCQHF